MAMKNPPHPGHSIRENCLVALGLSVTEAAKVLGVARHTLSRVLNGHAAISPEMAIRLEKAGWSNAEFWLRRQTSYDLTKARKSEGQIKVKRYQLPEVSSALLRMASLFGFAFGLAAHDLAPEGRSVPMRFEESDP